MYHNQDGSIAKIRLDLDERQWKLVKKALQFYAMEARGTRDGVDSEKMLEQLHEGM
jgi:hypothetical protein